MNTPQTQAALTALDRISKHYGKQVICCGCFVEGMRGDGVLQPDDPPMCCQSPDEDVDSLIEVARAALAQADAGVDLMQLLHDPENQPSQYGTVPLSWSEAKEIDEEGDAVRLVMANLLNAIANAVRGEPPALTRWSWHDLPDRVTAAMNFMRGATELAMELSAPQAVAQEAIAWLVYLPSEQAQYIYDSQDDPGYVEDLTHYGGAQVTPLYAAPPAEPVAASVVPEGFVLAPKVATPEMLAAGYDGFQNLEDAYGYMLAAAPQPAIKAEREPADRLSTLPARVHCDDSPDIEADWKFWQGIVMGEDGLIDPAKVRLELFDYSMMLGFYGTVLHHVTGGRCSMQNTHPSVVKSLADEYYCEICEDPSHAETVELFRIWQSYLGETRDQCDDSGRLLWDRIDAALAAQTKGE